MFICLVSSVFICMCRRHLLFFFFLMIRRPPRSTLDRSSAASDVYKRQTWTQIALPTTEALFSVDMVSATDGWAVGYNGVIPVSYTHLRAHETVLDLVCRLLLEKKNIIKPTDVLHHTQPNTTDTMNNNIITLTPHKSND